MLRVFFSRMRLIAHAPHITDWKFSTFQQWAKLRKELEAWRPVCLYPLKTNNLGSHYPTRFFSIWRNFIFATMWVIKENLATSFWNSNFDQMVSLISLLCKELSGFRIVTWLIFSSSGKLRYANNSNYKNDVMIRKEVRAGICHLCNFTSLILSCNCNSITSINP